MHKKKIGLGIDIGSVSVKLAVFSAQPSCLDLPKDFQPAPWRGQIAWISPYLRHQGSPLDSAQSLLDRVFSLFDVDTDDIRLIATGSGARQWARQNRLHYVNDFQTAAQGVARLYPTFKTVIELGGEQAKYLYLGVSNEGAVHILDYGTNGDCAAGTGSFLDQQAGRLHFNIDQVSEAVATCRRSATIAGRCSVFAKSDMIHAQQRGYAPAEVLKGLCEAVARNVKGGICKGKSLKPPVAFIGGMALNQGIAQALRQTFDLEEGSFVIPEAAPWIPAAGAALQALEREESRQSTAPAFVLGDMKFPVNTPLSLDRVRILEPAPSVAFTQEADVPAYLGIDIGSVSTNLALLDASGGLIHGIYTMTKGRPIEVVQEALVEMASVVQGRVDVCGVGTTGSGRELIGMLVGADVVKDEITAHKTGAMDIARRTLNRDVDTILEIGGQDSKFISIRDGVVVDFSLNEACAAGTGSFLEEQAKELGIAIKGEFAELALASPAPIRLGERCTVFMEKELKPYLHRGAAKGDIVAGLAFSVVQNYLNRVVKKRPIGETVFFQGGTAYNRAVAAAFATVLGKEIVVPPHNGIMGAIGAALLAKQHHEKQPGSASRFRGWHLENLHWKRREIACHGCDNRCAVQEFEVEGERSYWGDKCSTRFRKPARTSRRPVTPNLFELRQAALTDGGEAAPQSQPVTGRVALPMVLQFWDRLPFWRSYFHGLGIEVVLSGPTTRRHVDAGVEASVADPCFPIQLSLGHLESLLKTEADCLFLPNVVNEVDPTSSVASFLCPWAQTLPLVAQFTPALQAMKEKLWHPNVQFRMGSAFNEARLWQEARHRWPISRALHQKAWAAAQEAHDAFREIQLEQGRKALSQLQRSNREAVLLLGRPYNLYDPGLNLDIPAKLRTRYGVDVLPLDALDLDGVDIRPIHDHMFWNYGRRILQAASLAKSLDGLHIIYLSNFKCGPDSYIRHYVEEAAGEPILFLQLDSHANDAGVMTRIEAFLESKGLS